MSILLRLDADSRQAIDAVRRTLPVKLGELAARIGIKVFRATLPAGISGEIKKVGDDEYVIRINRHETPERQRFTLAHELGHFLLHRDQIGDGIVDDALYRSRLSNKLEYEANRFAAELLMPSDALTQVLGDKGKTNDQLIDYASSLFGVSKQAAQIRLGI